MRKLRKSSLGITNNVEAYGCSCFCNCACSCSCWLGGLTSAGNYNRQNTERGGTETGGEGRRISNMFGIGWNPPGMWG